MKLNCYLMMCLCFYSSILFAENIKIADQAIQKENVMSGIKYKSENRNITIMNYGPAKYNFIYNYINDPAYLEIYPKAILPQIGDVTANNTGAGLTPGWYRNGFLGISINGKNIKGKLAKINIIENIYARLEFVWELENGTVKAIFAVPANEDKIFVEVESNIKDELKTFQLVFSALPGHYGEKEKIDRWCSTVSNNWQNTTDGSKPQTLDPKKENWLLFYDGQNNKQLGSAGLLFDPEQVQTAKSQVGEKVITTELNIAPDFTKVRFLLWGFPEEYKTAKNAYDYLNENSSVFLKELRNFKF